MIIKNITVGKGRNTIASIAYNPHTDLLYAAVGHFLFVIDGLKGNVLKRLAIPYSAGDRLGTAGRLAINHRTDRVYLTNPVVGRLSIFDGRRQTFIRSIKLGNPAFTSFFPIVINEITNRVYVGVARNQKILVINGQTDQIETGIKVPSNFFNLVINPVLNRIYAFSPNDGLTNSISVIDGKNSKVIGSLKVKVNTGVFDVAVSPRTNRVYVASENVVSVFNGENNRRLSNITVSSPATLQINPLTNLLYVDTVKGTPHKDFVTFVGKVVVINGQSNKIIDTIPNVGNNQGSFAFKPLINLRSNQIFVLDDDTRKFQLDIINGRTNAVSRLTLPSFGLLLAVNERRNLVYFAGEGGKTITVIQT